MQKRKSRITEAAEKKIKAAEESAKKNIPSAVEYIIKKFEEQMQ